VRSVSVPTTYITASARPQAILQPSAATSTLRTSPWPASATLSAPMKVIAISTPKITSETRSIWLRTRFTPG
jgi:hypothetical protein